MPIYRPPPIDSKQAERMRKLVEESRELLKQSALDTFAGRKTQEPFPPADDPMERGDFQIRSGLEPPSSE